MKLSDLELSAYDLAAIILPGAIGIAEIGITWRGLTPFWGWISQLSVAGGLVLAMSAFGLGHLISQAALEGATVCGKFRTHHRGRDKHWKLHGQRIAALLSARHAIEIDIDSPKASDRAFNCCLTVIGDAFEKRRVFSLVAALSLCLWLLSLFALIPAWRCIRAQQLAEEEQVISAIAAFLACGLSAALAWRRSQLYFDLADVTVFDVFEAWTESPSASPSQGPAPEEG